MNQRETKKEKIIRTTIELFRRTHNYNKVSIEEIAREAGVSPTTVYNNFGNRDNLVVEVLKQIGLAGLESYRAIIRSDIPFTEKIEMLMQKKIQAAQEMDLDVMEKAITQNAQLAEFVAEVHEHQIKPVLLELIRDGKQQGYIEPGISDEAIMLYLELLQESGVAFFRIVKAQQDNEKVLQDFNRILFHGFMKGGKAA